MTFKKIDSVSFSNKFQILLPKTISEIYVETGSEENKFEYIFYCSFLKIHYKLVQNDTGYYLIEALKMNLTKNLLEMFGGCHELV